MNQIEKAKISGISVEQRRMISFIRVLILNSDLTNDSKKNCFYFMCDLEDYLDTDWSDWID